MLSANTPFQSASETVLCSKIGKKKNISIQAENKSWNNTWSKTSCNTQKPPVKLWKWWKKWHKQMKSQYKKLLIPFLTTLLLFPLVYQKTNGKTSLHQRRPAVVADVRVRAAAQQRGGALPEALGRGRDPRYPRHRRKEIRLLSSWYLTYW